MTDTQVAEWKDPAFPDANPVGPPTLLPTPGLELRTTALAGMVVPSAESTISLHSNTCTYITGFPTL